MMVEFRVSRFGVLGLRGVRHGRFGGFGYRVLGSGCLLPSNMVQLLRQSPLKASSPESQSTFPCFPFALSQSST